ncbi:MAG: hypothetical protein G01um101433_625 [Parcubacteria group bacterium Gr01-1014_33]|nr:MAG: hypothetical protein G01um101433_625 [Parcubacteria group bacterium Gr01-1014_33]
MKISVKVKPNAREKKVEQSGANSFRVSVRAVSKEGKANQEVIELMSEYFDIPRSRVRIIRGYAAKEKIIEIE